MAKVSLPIDAFIVLEGKAKSNGKDYAFIKLEKRYANNANLITKLKANGVQVNGSGADTDLDVDVG